MPMWSGSDGTKVSSISSAVSAHVDVCLPSKVLGTDVLPLQPFAHLKALPQGFEFRSFAKSRQAACFYFLILVRKLFRNELYSARLLSLRPARLALRRFFLRLESSGDHHGWSPLSFAALLRGMAFSTVMPRTLSIPPAWDSSVDPSTRLACSARVTSGNQHPVRSFNLVSWRRFCACPRAAVLHM